MTTHPSVERARRTLRRLDFKPARARAMNAIDAVNARQRRDHAATFVRKVFVNPSPEELERKEARMQRHKDSIARAHAVLNRHEPETDGLVYKRFEMPRAVETQPNDVEPEPRSISPATQAAANGSTPRMTAEQSQPWNDWLEAGVKKIWFEAFMPEIAECISKRLEEAADIFGEEIGKLNREQNERIQKCEVEVAKRDAEITNLSERLRQMNTELVLLQHKVRRAKANPLPPGKTKRAKGRR